MKKAILAKKIRMTQVFDEKGAIVPCTVLDVSNVSIEGLKNINRDGYEAVLLKKMTGKRSSNKFLKEVRLEEGLSLGALGETVSVDGWTTGSIVNVVGWSKGKGFQGVMKAHNMRGGPATHGQSTKPRSIGSIGPGQTFARVMKGRRMAKKMGNERITVKNLELVKIDLQSNLIYVKGAVPGNSGANLIVYC